MSGSVSSDVFGSGFIASGPIPEYVQVSVSGTSNWLSGIVSVVSGAILSGHFSSGIVLVSGPIGSGGYSPITDYPLVDSSFCCQCGNRIFVSSGQSHAFIFGTNIPVFSGQFYPSICGKCLGYNHEEKRIDTREHWIREGLPLWHSGAPTYVIADYLEDAGRQKDADYMRNLDRSD